ncbi:restless-like transposase [Fusarium beomiforme]|uniref:Restless-like transposase n=1 Tax=Fusarium beomiforme TaxID=44412 RepID=A0A9P5ASI0_9HYPO|nr:restless-like transposase [Fusarium beomiforme]
MDVNVSAKRQRTLDFDVSSVPLIDLDALPDDWEIFPWNKFPGFTISERAGRQTSWVWLHGYDIQDQTSPTKWKWVCRPCLQKPKPRISDFSSVGTQNIKKHLFREHKLVDESGKRQPALGTGLKEKTSSGNIVEMLHLNTSGAKEQAIANALIQRFDRDYFQRLLLDVLYVDDNGAPSKLVLGLPELKDSHSGENISAQILEILESYEIIDKVRYMTLDDAGNMDTATEEITRALGVDPKHRRVRCFGHVLNLVVKALLFGQNHEAFEAEVDGEPGFDAVQHEIWRKKGPVGKLHNLVHWIHRSDKLTYRLRALQEEFFQHSESPRIRARKPLDVVRDNQTRWLSTLYMMRRGLKLRPFLEDLVEKAAIEFNRERRNGIRMKEEMPLCLCEESLLSENDWKVVGLMDEVLVDFEEALRMLEGDAQRRTRKGGAY